ncbi:uncharacterized protein [Spinacia oleracea]|uniref:Uncharacterized protein isoform X2 n=1 Tax=Spinacia oleracea TaxID=3562 RepID=A0A9R0JV08_SPIOL|nr:uncharacterized protein LOC110787718 isoform X2 [Spinacia oleracea]
MSTMEDHKFQLPPSTHCLRSSKYSRISENFKHSVFRLANSDPNNPLPPSQIAFIEQKIRLTFPAFHTPNHPPYSSMIESAIEELKKEDGSNVESITKKIKEKYDSLPWAHSIYVSHHLRKMCENGEVVCTSSKLYTTPGLIEKRNMKSKQARRRLGRKRKEFVIKEGNSVEEIEVEESGDVKGFQEEKVFGRSRMKRRRGSRMVVKEDDEVGGAWVVGGDNTVTSTCSSQNLGVDKCNKEVAVEDGGDVTGRRRLKRLRLKCAVLEEDDEIGGAAVVGGEHNIVGSSQNLMVDKCNEAVAVEYGDEVTGGSRPKRKRWSCMVVEDDDVGGGATVIRGDHRSSQNLVVVKCNEALGVKDGDDVTGKASEISDELGGIGTVGEDDVLEEPQTEFQCQVNSQVLSLDDDECAEKTEPELLAPLSVGVLHAETEGEDKNKMVSMADDKTAAKSVHLPLECVKKSSVDSNMVLNIRVDGPEAVVKESFLKENELMIVPFVDNTPLLHAEPEGEDKNDLVSMLDDKSAAEPVHVPVEYVMKSSLNTNTVSNVRVDGPKAAVEESFLKGNELMIVPIVDNTPISAVNAEINTERGDNIIVCGLSIPDLDQPKRKKQVYSSKKRFKACQRKMKVASKSMPSKPALAVGRNLLDHFPLHELSSRRGVEPKLCATLLESPKVKELPSGQSQHACTSLLEDGSIKQLERRKSLDPLHYPRSLEDLITVADEENLPLQQVLEKCGKRKKHAGQLLTANTPLPTEASLISASKLQLNLSTSVKSVAKNKEKQPPQQWRQELKPQDLKHCSFEADTAAATGSKTSPLLKMEKRRNRQRRIEHEPKFPVDSAEENVDMVHQHQQKGQGQDQESSLHLKLTAETFAFCDEGRSWEENKQTRSDHDLPCESEQSIEVTTVESSPIQHLNGKEDEVYIGEMVTTALMEEKVSTQDHDYQKFIDQQKEAKEVDKISSHELVTDCRSVLPQVMQSGFVVTEHVASEILQREQEKHQKQPITKSPFSVPPLQHQIEDQEDKSQTDRLQDLEATMATVVEENVRTSYQNVEQQIKLEEREIRQRPLKQLELSKEDVVSSSNEHLQQQEGMSKPASYQNLKRQNKQQKVRGVPRTKKRTTGEVVDSLNLQPQLQGLSELATGQHSQQQREQPKKRGRPLKYTEETKGSAVALSNVNLQQLGMSEKLVDENSQWKIKQPKKGGTRRQRNKIEATKEDKPVSLKLHFQPQDSCEPSTGLQSEKHTEQVKNISLERPRKQRKATMPTNEDEVASLNLHAPQQEWLSESAIGEHSQQKIKLPETVSRGRTRKQIEVSKEDAAVLSNLHLQQQVESSEPDKSQSEVHGTPETGQAMPPSDEDIHQLPKKQKLHSGVQRPKTRAMTAASDNQPNQQEEEQHCLENEEKQGKFEGQQRPLKEKPVKITVVSLASKDQLRSRIKRQPQDST